MPRFKTRQSAFRQHLLADRMASYSLLTLAAIAVATALSYLSMPLIPFVLAVFLTYIVTPLVDFFQSRLHLPRWCALALAFLIAAGGIAFASGLVLANFQDLLTSADVYQARLILLASELSLLAVRYHIPVDQNYVLSAIREIPVFSTLAQAAGQVMNVLMSAFLVLIFLFFLVMGSNPARERTGIYAEIDLKIRQYLATKLATSAATGVLVGVTLAILGVDMAVMFGLITFLLNFIPTIGAVVATLLPLPVALLQFDEPFKWLLVVLIPGALQAVIGNFIEPKLLSDSLDLHPAAVLLALTFWGIIWGPTGMFLAIPIVVVLKIAMARIPTTRPFAELLAGRLPILGSK